MMVVHQLKIFPRLPHGLSIVRNVDYGLALTWMWPPIIIKSAKPSLRISENFCNAQACITCSTRWLSENKLFMVEAGYSDIS